MNERYNSRLMDDENNCIKLKKILINPLNNSWRCTVRVGKKVYQ